jgi:hypothetical protein
MPMFKKNLKLIATAIGLVTVLVMGLAMPGATQQNPLSRASVVNAISNAVAATLTAAEGDVFDTENAKFYSDARMAFALIPLNPSSRSYQVLEQNLYKLRTDEDLNVTVAAFYVPEDVPSFVKAGTYIMKLMNRSKAVLVDQEGREAFSGSVRIERTEGKLDPKAWWLFITNPRLIIHLFSVVTIIYEW